MIRRCHYKACIVAHLADFLRLVGLHRSPGILSKLDGFDFHLSPCNPFQNVYVYVVTKTRG